MASAIDLYEVGLAGQRLDRIKKVDILKKYATELILLLCVYWVWGDWDIFSRLFRYSDYGYFEDFGKRNSLSFARLNVLASASESQMASEL